MRPLPRASSPIARLVGLVLAVAGVFGAWRPAGAQTGPVSPAERQACLDGYVAFCDADRMAPADVARGRARHLANNRAACAQAARGEPAPGCDWSLLSRSEASAAAAAGAGTARARAFAACLAGADAGAGCDEAVLTAAERREVAAVDLARNLTRCLTGRPADALLCDRTRLSPAERRSVEAAARGRRAELALAEASAGAGDGAPAAARDGLVAGAPDVGAAGAGTTGVSTTAANPPVTPAAGCAENGSCAGDISAATGRPKTVFVGGYTRRDGTYVRGHVRSAPRKH